MYDCNKAPAYHSRDTVHRYHATCVRRHLSTARCCKNTATPCTRRPQNHINYDMSLASIVAISQIQTHSTHIVSHRYDTSVGPPRSVASGQNVVSVRGGSNHRPPCATTRWRSTLRPLTSSHIRRHDIAACARAGAACPTGVRSATACCHRPASSSATWTCMRRKLSDAVWSVQRHPNVLLRRTGARQMRTRSKRAHRCIHCGQTFSLAKTLKIHMHRAHPAAFHMSRLSCAGPCASTCSLFGSQRDTVPAAQTC